MSKFLILYCPQSLLLTEQKKTEERIIKRNIELESLFTISFVLHTTKNLAEILPLLIDQVLSAFKTHAGAIWLYNPMDAVVNDFDALTNNRPYRQAYSRQGALKHIKSVSKKHFDPQVVEIFHKT